jgi:hypothetical protein
MDDIDKRPRYFNGQFLDQRDFNLALDYVRERAQRHQRLLHSPGIAGDGLAVTAGVGASTITVAPGTAVDALGQQIVLLESRPLNLTGLPDQTALVVISYHEEPVDKADSGKREDTRWYERPEVALVRESGAPPEDTHLRLARLKIEGGKVTVHDPSVRRSSGARMGASLETQRLALTREGLAPASWPSLTCISAERAVVANDLLVARDLVAQQDIWATRDMIAGRNLTVRGTLGLVVTGKPVSLTGVDGKLGIGTADPKALVEVNSGSPTVSPVLAVSTPNAEDFFSIYGPRQNGQSTNLLWRRGPLSFGTATTFGGQAYSEKMRINETGEVGIGVDPGTYRLAIRQAASTTGRGLRVLNADSATTVQLWAGGGGGVLDAEGATNLHLRTGSVDRLVIDKGGNVGIGTSSPTDKLHVAGFSRVEGLWIQRASDGVNAGTLNLGLEPAADNFWHITQRSGDQDKLMILRRDPGQYKGPYLAITTDGKVGIGTSSPEERLHIGGNLRLDAGTEISFVNNGKIRSFSDHHAIFFKENKLEIREAGDLIFSPGATDAKETAKIVMLSNGNVGINAPDPGTYRLAIRQAASASGRGLRVLSADSATTVQLWAGTGGSVLDAEGATNLHLRTGGQDRLFVDKGGNVGIGTSSPTDKLHVAGFTRAEGLWIQRASDGVNAGTLNLGREAAADNFWHITQRSGDQDKLMIFRRDPGPPAGYKGPYLAITTEGKVGIGTATPTGVLHVVNSTSKTGAGALVVENKNAAGFTHFDYPDGKNYIRGTTILADDGTRVGIGTSSPVATLHVIGTSILGQEDWRTPGFQNNWKNYGSGYNPAGFMIDSMGFVHLRGLVKDGAIGDGIPIFTLPAGYTPPFRQLHVVQTNQANAGRVDILADGRICVIVGNASWLSLDGITFRAGSQLFVTLGSIGTVLAGLGELR